MSAAPKLCLCAACSWRNDRPRPIDAATVRAAFAAAEADETRRCPDCARDVFACRCDEDA